MSYETRYTDDSHGMAEPVSLIPKTASKIKITSLAEPTVDVVHEHSSFAATAAAIEQEDSVSDEETEASQTLYECEQQVIRFEMERMMKLAVNTLAEMSLRADFECPKGWELMLAQCRMLSANGCNEKTLLALHAVMFPDSIFYKPMKRFSKRFQSRIPTNVITLEKYRVAGKP